MRISRWLLGLATIGAMAMHGAGASTSAERASHRIAAGALVPTARAPLPLEAQLVLAFGANPGRARLDTTADLAGTQGQGLPPDWDTVTANGFDLCGDGVIDAAGEQCDGSDFAGATCESLGLGSGSLTCSQSSCRIYPTCSGLCSATTCEVDADCEQACGPCVHPVPGAPGTCSGAGGAE